MRRNEELVKVWRRGSDKINEIVRSDLCGCKALLEVISWMMGLNGCEV